MAQLSMLVTFLILLLGLRDLLSIIEHSLAFDVMFLSSSE